MSSIQPVNQQIAITIAIGTEKPAHPRQWRHTSTTDRPATCRNHWLTRASSLNIRLPLMVPSASRRQVALRLQRRIGRPPDAVRSSSRPAQIECVATGPHNDHARSRGTRPAHANALPPMRVTRSGPDEAGRHRLLRLRSLWDPRGVLGPRAAAVTSPGGPVRVRWRLLRASDHGRASVRQRWMDGEKDNGKEDREAFEPEARAHQAIAARPATNHIGNRGRPPSLLWSFGETTSLRCGRLRSLRAAICRIAARFM
jgi:hypothetical protein